MRVSAVRSGLLLLFVNSPSSDRRRRSISAIEDGPTKSITRIPISITSAIVSLESFSDSSSPHSSSITSGRSGANRGELRTALVFHGRWARITTRAECLAVERSGSCRNTTRSNHTANRTMKSRQNSLPCDPESRARYPKIGMPLCRDACAPARL
jgi:hypothetical protein